MVPVVFVSRVCGIGSLRVQNGLSFCPYFFPTRTNRLSQATVLDWKPYQLGITCLRHRWFSVPTRNGNSVRGPRKMASRRVESLGLSACRIMQSLGSPGCRRPEKPLGRQASSLDSARKGHLRRSPSLSSLFATSDALPPAPVDLFGGQKHQAKEPSETLNGFQGGIFSPASLSRVNLPYRPTDGGDGAGYFRKQPIPTLLELTL